MIGVSIGPYRILGKLGAGGQGQVRLAEDIRLRRKVALKSLSESWTGSSEARARLLHEARIIAQLNHPRIAAIYDVLESGAETHIVMEYVEGEPLSDRVKRGPLELAEVLRIGVQVADALGEAHTHGVIHRDLKPSNLVMTQSGRVKVLDFGLAKQPHALAQQRPEEETLESASITLPGMIVGTLPYMPPEQVLGETVDARSDIYSLGVVLFELLTGRKPFGATGAVSLAMKILTEPTPVVADINPQVAPGASEAIARAMARDPGQRYASAAEFQEDLECLLNAVEGGGAKKPAFWLRSWRGALRTMFAPVWRRALAAACVLILGILGFLAVRWWVDSRRGGVRIEGPPPVIAVLPFVNLTGNSAHESACAGLPVLLTSSLASVRSLAVVPWSGTLGYQSAKRELSKIARELGANLVVDGVLQLAEGKLLATVSLVRAGPNTVVWSKSYAATTGEPFQLHAPISKGLLDALRTKATPQERERAVALPTADRDALAEYLQGRKFLDREDRPESADQAIRLFESAIAKDPGFILARAGIGQACLLKYKRTREQGWVNRAREAVTEALRLDSERGEVRYLLALICDGTGRYAEAADEARKAIALSPNSEEAHRLLGDVLLKQNRGEEALAEYRKAIEIRPEYWRTHASLGFACFQLGRSDQAIAAFNRVKELQPDSPWGFQQAGTVYHSINNLEMALANYQEAIRRGGSPKTHSNIGMIYYARKDFARAVQAYEQAVLLDPANPTTRRNLGDTYRRLGEREKSRAEYLRAVQLTTTQLEVNSRDAPILALRALCEAKLGRRDEADRDARQALALRPGDREVAYKAAVVHALAGRNAQALAALEEALRLKKSPYEVWMDDDLDSLKPLPEFKRLVPTEP